MKRFVVDLDEAELTLRFVETVVGLDRARRAPGVKPAELLDNIESSGTREHQAMVNDLKHCARVAMQYFTERVASGGKPEGGAMRMFQIDPSKDTLQ